MSNYHTFGSRIRRDVASKEKKATKEETSGHDQYRTSIRGKDHVS